MDRPPKYWEDDSRNDFPPGQNPWHDLYPEAVIKNISAVISLGNDGSVVKLRTLLACFAEDVASQLQFIGTPTAASYKSKWCRRTLKEAKQLRALLNDASDNYSIAIEKNKTKTGVHISPASAMAKCVDASMTSLNDLIRVLEFRDRTASNEKDRQRSSGKNLTPIAQFLRYVVDGLRDIFIHFCGANRMRRISEPDGIRGEFPDFIRDAAAPLLNTYRQIYVDAQNGYAKLDAQIAQTIKDYRRAV